MLTDKDNAVSKSSSIRLLDDTGLHVLRVVCQSVACVTCGRR